MQIYGFCIVMDCMIKYIGLLYKYHSIEFQFQEKLAALV